MQQEKRPYAVLPRLVEQPTWGGGYIARLKKIKHLGPQKIGQSYELSNRTMLLPDLMDVSGRGVGAALLGAKTIPVSEIDQAGRLPLIKLTQAAGNSFQLHARPHKESSSRWRPKAESWFYLEPGTLTFGIRANTDVDRYREVCNTINNLMMSLSADVCAKKRTIAQARDTATNEIKQINPWQFVNTHRVSKGAAIDLSGGGIHHSWEEDPEWAREGNIVYEVQEDVDDSTCTIRSFDQGKIKDDGSIREIHVDDYFRHIDTKPESNQITRHSSIGRGLVFDSPHYCMEVVVVRGETKRWDAETSFHHLYVHEGGASIQGGGTTLFLERGHSCFIPKDTTYKIETKTSTTLLKTYQK